jgi:3-hydroxyacyl-CoA dehydrogenase
MRLVARCFGSAEEFLAFGLHRQAACLITDILMPRMSGLELIGHVANRLQAALYSEVVYLIEQGVLDVADSDAAACWGPGLRWGLMGPNLLFHLAGGEGGIQHFMEYLSGPVATLVERSRHGH